MGRRDKGMRVVRSRDYDDRIDAWMQGAAAIALLILCLWGDAIADWLDPGRIDRRIEAVEQEHARAVCEAFGTCGEARR